MNTNTFTRRWLAVAAMTALLGGGCAADADTTIDVGEGTTGVTQTPDPVANEAEPITVTAKEFSFDGPVELSGGLREVVLVNEGEEAHHLQLLELKEGETIETFGAAAAESEGAAMAKVFFVGGPGQALPGTSATAWVDLGPGNYLYACFIPSQSDGVPHLAKGMLVPVTVTEAEAVATVSPVASVSAQDYGFAGIDSIAAGATFQFSNGGTEVHEANVISLAEGATAESVVEWLQAEEKPGPPPFAPAGGNNAIDPGSSDAWATAPSAPGNYAFVCFVPSPDGTPHIFKGMIHAFTVT